MQRFSTPDHNRIEADSPPPGIMDHPRKSPAAVALIPARNNGATLGELIDRIRDRGLDCIVVNDGSTDNTSSIIQSIPESHRIEFSRNRGKGVALRAGFKKAAALGYTHALTLDADGQHLPEDIPLFLNKINEKPDTLWIGNRKVQAGTTGQPLRSRFGANFGAFWYQFHTGNRIADTQCGFRAYPLHLIQSLDCTGDRYEFEIEILILSAWNGIAVEQVPVHRVYFEPGKSVSHFRPVRDFLRISVVNSKASLTRIFLPWKTIHAPGKSAKEKLLHLVKSELKAHSTPRRAAASLSLGVFMSIFPIHGFQVVTLMTLAFIFKLNRALAFLGVSLSSPPMLPFLIALAIGIGKLVVPANIVSLSGSPKANTFLQYGLEWFIGSIILSIIAGITTYIFAYPAFLKLRQARRLIKKGARGPE
ncbi:MAG: DUF2062 domain-containing protein [Chitinivibrionales bacterium]|nr:DUF2062 domain-containing protein [Chitinivibrionales bacterium]